MTRLLGLRHDIIAKDDVYYLLFYDIDGHALTPQQLDFIDTALSEYNISYFIIKTKNGYHIIGLTAMTPMIWGILFTRLKGMLKSYYGGIVIRLSRKQDEKQELIAFKEYGEIIPNLYNLYANRFGLDKKPWIKELSKYLLVFEKYRTEKE